MGQKDRVRNMDRGTGTKGLGQGQEQGQSDRDGGTGTRIFIPRHMMLGS